MSETFTPGSQVMPQDKDMTGEAGSLGPSGKAVMGRVQHGSSLLSCVSSGRDDLLLQVWIDSHPVDP